MLNQEQVSRIGFEAFSQFTSRLSKTNSLEEVQECLQHNLKYLFDFSTMKITYQGNGHALQMYTGIGKQGSLRKDSAEVSEFEKKLRNSGVPTISFNTEAGDVFNDMTGMVHPLGQTWGWNYQGGHDRDLTLCIALDPDQDLSSRDMTFLKLFAENLESKLLQLALYSELADKNKYLNEALRTIREKNSEIQAIMEQQNEVIELQTGELKAKNKKLLDISMLNAHRVREPLSRIVGLIQVMEHSENDEIPQIFNMLSTSSKDLDQALREVIKVAETEFENYNSH